MSAVRQVLYIVSRHVPAMLDRDNGECREAGAVITRHMTDSVKRQVHDQATVDMYDSDAKEADTVIARCCHQRHVHWTLGTNGGDCVGTGAAI